MKNGSHLRYKLLAEASVMAAEGLSSDQILAHALENALAALGLVSSSVRVIDDSGKLLFAQIAGDGDFAELMRQTEEKMLAVLRSEFQVRNIFLTFERDGLFSLFSYPLKMGEKILGTISGISSGERSLAAEEEFIKATSAVLGLVLSRDKGQIKASPHDLLKAKAEAVVETAVTINHEVNNPLTAVLGNIQLVLMNADRLPADILTRLKAAEQSALKIKEVTQNLMKIVEPSVIEYTTGLKMVDLSKSILQKTEDENKKKPDK